MNLFYIWEHNRNDSLVYAENFTGAFTRGASLEEALEKMPSEIVRYCKWRHIAIPDSVELICSLDAPSVLNICDADSDVIFESEKEPLTIGEYNKFKNLALRSASDFLSLYNSIPDKNFSIYPKRSTFYGQAPRTAYEMYEHTKNVNKYYFREIGVEADNCGNIFECRNKGFESLERQDDFLRNEVHDGSYNEKWSLRKVIRRFIWHDRIHAKAMYRMSAKAFPDAVITDRFFFGGN